METETTHAANSANGSQQPDAPNAQTDANASSEPTTSAPTPTVIPEGGGSGEVGDKVVVDKGKDKANDDSMDTANAVPTADEIKKQVEHWIKGHRQVAVSLLGVHADRFQVDATIGPEYYPFQISFSPAWEPLVRIVILKIISYDTKIYFRKAILNYLSKTNSYFLLVVFVVRHEGIAKLRLVGERDDPHAEAGTRPDERVERPHRFGQEVQFGSGDQIVGQVERRHLLRVQQRMARPTREALHKRR